MTTWTRLLSLSFLALLIAPAAQAMTDLEEAAASEVTIRRATIATRADGRGVVLRLHTDGRGGSIVQEASTGNRLTFRAPQARLARGFSQPTARGAIRHIAVREEGGNVRIDVDIDPAIAVSAAVYPDRDSNDLLVALATSERPRAVAAVESHGPAPIARDRATDNRNVQQSTPETPNRAPLWAGNRRTEASPAPVQAPVARQEPIAQAQTRSVGWGARQVETERVQPRATAGSPPDVPNVRVPAPRAIPSVAARNQTTRARRSSRQTERNAPERPPIVQQPVAETAIQIEVPPADRRIYQASTSNWALDCIVLDAGHGGHDPGARAHGVQEKDITLGVTRRLGRMIEQEMGVRVVYTRTDDRFIELRDRGRIANQSCGKLFISIHGNSVEGHSPTAHGAETYFLGLARTASAQAVMERENSVINLEEDPSLYADYHGEAAIVRALATTAYQQESEALATLIQQNLTAHPNRRDRGVKQANFLVLWAASMPAVLVELGFVSNPEEARYMASDSGQEEMARSIFTAIESFRDRYERALATAP